MIESKSAKFKVAIIGAHRFRVAKVLSLLIDDDAKKTSHSHPTDHLSPVTSSTLESLPSSIENNNDNDNEDDDQSNIILRRSVQYIPCVATFDSYEDETDGKSIRYLSKIEYHGLNATQVCGSSLAPFFDGDDDGFNGDNADDSHDNDDKSKTLVKKIPGIAGVAIGCGIESKQDIVMIMTFLQSMSVHKKVVIRLPTKGIQEKINGTISPSTISTATRRLVAATKSSSSQEEGDDKNSIVVQCIQPNAEYESMEDENNVYKQMSHDQKQLVTLKQTMGPGKMATFVRSLVTEIGIAHHLIPSSLSPPSCSQMQDNNHDESTNELFSTESSIGHNHCTENENKQEDKAQEIQQPIHRIKHMVRQNNITQFACKQCRTILFNEHDQEDPPHIKAQHTFNRSKVTSSTCNSVFLAEGLDWMGDISTSMEGKLCCPKCTAKLGLWKWAGTQCSCGTWITPAIQIRSSRVDVILADDCCRIDARGSGSALLPQGTVMPKSVITPVSVEDSTLLSLAGLHVADSE